MFHFDLSLYNRFPTFQVEELFIIDVIVYYSDLPLRSHFVGI